MTTTDSTSQIRAAHPPVDGRPAPPEHPVPFYAVGGLDPDFTLPADSCRKQGLLARLVAGFQAGANRH